MVTDDLAMQGARASATMVLTYFSQNSLISRTKMLTDYNTNVKRFPYSGIQNNTANMPLMIWKSMVWWLNVWPFFMQKSIFEKNFTVVDIKGYQILHTKMKCMLKSEVL